MTRAISDRAKRMVDFGMEEVEVTFDLGNSPSEEEVQEMQIEMEELRGESR